MIKKLNILKEIITKDNIYEVKYTLREYSNGARQRTYGYCLEEYVYIEEGDGRMLIERAEAPAVFDDYKTAEAFYIKIIDGDVFPQTLQDHIDDWYCAFHPSQMQQLP